MENNTNQDIDNGMGVEVFDSEKLLDAANKAKDITDIINELDKKENQLLKFIDDDIHRICIKIECGDRCISLVDGDKNMVRGIVDILNNIINTKIEELKKYVIVSEEDNNDETNSSDN